MMTSGLWSMRAAACLLGASLLAACGNGGGGDDATTLHRGNRIEPLSLDPDIAHIMDERTIVADLFTGLYEPSAEGRPLPALAMSAETSQDGRTWTFGLREANWSDGEPLTAEDVVFGLRRALDPATGNQYAAPLLIIDNAEAVYAGRLPPEALGVTAIDAARVEIRLESPAPYLPSVLMYWGQPVPRHAVEAHGSEWIRPENIVTSGAFTLAEWRLNNFIHLEANPEFFAAEEVCLTDVYYYPTVDTAAAERRVRAGELDLNNEFSSGNTGFLQSRHPELVQAVPGLTLRHIGFNTDRAPFDDARVRNALSMAVDRRFITGEVLAGLDVPAWRVTPAGLSGRREDVALGFRDTDMQTRRDLALRLLEEAGFGPDNPLRFTVYYQPASSWPRIVPVVQQDWMELAPWIEVELVSRDSQLHYDAMRAGDYQVATSGWVPDFDDPYAVLLQWESRAGEINYSRWTDPDYDRLTDAALRTDDPDERADLLAEAEQILLDASPVIPVFFQGNTQLVGPQVSGWISNPAAINVSRWLCVNREAGAG